MPIKNGVVTVGNNETTPMIPDFLIDEFVKASESRLSETTIIWWRHNLSHTSSPGVHVIL